MSKITDKIKVLLGIAKQTFGKVSTDKKDIFFDGEIIDVNTRVYDDEGNALEDGEYNDGTNIYAVVDSVVKEIRKVEENPEKTTTETTKTETEEKTEKMAETETTEEIKEEIKEEIVENGNGEPTTEERISALEELVASLFDEIRQMKVREVERASKNEEIVREFSAFKASKTAESVTKTDATEKEFACERKADKLKNLKNKK
jgi:hypothetical protein